jgi:protein TonB
LPKIGDLLGPVTQPLPQVEPQSVPMAAAPTLALLLTPPSELKPPYPQSKLLTGEEATLKLALSIDEHGRVVAVEPVGPADKVFLDAARRYLIAHWRYRPATLDGRPVASNLTITLRFELD